MEWKSHKEGVENQEVYQRGHLVEGRWKRRERGLKATEGSRKRKTA